MRGGRAAQQVSKGESDASKRYAGAAPQLRPLRLCAALHVFRIAPGGGTVTPIGTARDYADLALDTDGNVFATRYDQGRVNRITPGGVETTFSSGASYPIGVTFDSAGTLFVTDGNLDADGNGRVLTIDANGTATPFAIVPGAAAIVAQVPEPATTVALAVLGVVLAGRRRKRDR